MTDPQDPRFIVAEKPGQWSITRAELNNEVDLLLHQQNVTRAQIGPAKMPILESRLLHGMTIEKLLLERSKELSLPADDVDRQAAELLQRMKGQVPTEQEFENQLKTSGITLDDLKKRIHEDVLIRQVLEAEALKNVKPSDQEVDDFYLKNKAKFVVPQKVRASRVLIMVDDHTSPADKKTKRKELEAARERVMKGEDFGKVASEVSEDRYSAPKGGDIGYFQRGENEADFDTVAFSLKPGVVSPIFETPMGLQFIKVTDTQPGGLLDIAQVRDAIAQHLQEEKSAEAENTYTKDLLAKSGVIFHLVQVDLPQTPGEPPPAPAPSPDGTAPTTSGT